MLQPVLAILVAGSFQLAADSPRAVELSQIVHELTLAVAPSPAPSFQGVPEPTVCDVPFYYSDFSPFAVPQTATIITYDWRSPVVFDLP